MIGRKIDCPKCKYRFVVEEPAEEEAELDDAEEGGDGVKTKPGAKKKRTGQAPEKKAKKSNKMVLVLALAGAGVVLLVVAGVLIFGGVFGDSKEEKKGGTSPSSRFSGGPGRAGTVEPDDNPNKEEKKDKEEPNKPVDLVSNLLPNDSELVLNLSPQDILKSPLGKPAFETPGAFQKKMFEDNFGIPLDNLERILVAGNITQNWFFAVIKTSAPIPQETVQKTLGLKKAENPPLGQDYFVMTSDWLAKELNRGSEFLEAKGKAGAAAAAARTVGVRFHSQQVLVLADMVPLKKFLADKSTPAQLYKPPQEKPAEADQAEGGPGPAGGGRGGPPAGGGGGAAGGMMERMQENMQAMRSGQRGGGPRGGMGGPMGGMQAGTSTSAAPPPASNSYLTINPQMKAMLDRVEAKEPVIFSLAMDLNPFIDRAKGRVEFLFTQDILPRFGGLSVGMKEKITAIGALEFPDQNLAQSFSQQFQTNLQVWAQLAEAMGNFRIDVPGAGGAGMMGRGGMAEMMTRGMRRGGAGGPQGPGGAGTPPGPGANRSPTDQGQPAPGRPGFGPGGQPFGPGGGNANEQNYIGTAKVDIGSHEKTLQLSVEVTLKQPAMDLVQKGLEMGWIRARGEIASARINPVPYDLAQTLKAYEDQKGHYPRGAFARKPSAERKERPWPPDQRVSWLADLLPFMGYDEIYNKIDFEKSWRDKENYLSSMALIPQFLDGRDPNRSRYVRYPGMLYEVAATDYVGIAGIGLDAADYSDKDPAVAKKLGVFGYDRVTKAEDIKDGLDNTILMLQIPSPYKSPWIAGGGSTVRGVPETRSVQPFVSVQADGKRGTMAIMANGAVRFIGEDIDDKVFQAMCTYQGAEKVDVEKNTTIVPDLRLETKAEKPAAPKEEKPAKEEKKK
jgi:hypothetical protein